jgi:hypothetical protein
MLLPLKKMNFISYFRQKWSWGWNKALRSCSCGETSGQLQEPNKRQLPLPDMTSSFNTDGDWKDRDDPWTQFQIEVFQGWNSALASGPHILGAGPWPINSESVARNHPSRKQALDVELFYIFDDCTRCCTQILKLHWQRLVHVVVQISHLKQLNRSNQRNAHEFQMGVCTIPKARKPFDRWQPTIAACRSTYRRYCILEKF